MEKCFTFQNDEIIIKRKKENSKNKKLSVLPFLPVLAAGIRRTNMNKNMNKNILRKIISV
jgi:hypothetical protein